MKKYIIVLFLTVMYSQAFAIFSMKVKTYTMYMPKIVFENVRNIYVEDVVVVSSSKEWTQEFGTKISNNIKSQIKNSARGAYSKGYYTQCSWMKTNVYNLVDNAAEADLVISGTLKGTFTKKDKNSVNKLTLKEQSIPYFEENFNHTKLASMEITIKFIKKDGKCLHTYSDTFKNNLDETFYGKDGYVNSDASVVANHQLLISLRMLYYNI